MEELGGLFANLCLDDDEIRQDLERIYVEFCQDPDCELKLNKPHMWYASPVIDDYYFKREKNLHNLTWIRDILTLRFFRARNPKVDVKLVALNLGDPVLLKEFGLLEFNDVADRLTKIQRLITLAKLKRDISYVIEMVKMDDINLIPVIEDCLKEYYGNKTKDTDFISFNFEGSECYIYDRYVINFSYTGEHRSPVSHKHVHKSQLILMFSVEVGATKIYEHLSSLDVYTRHIYYAMAYSNRIHKYDVDFRPIDSKCLMHARDLSLFYGSMESFNILQSYIQLNLPKWCHEFDLDLCIRSDVIRVYQNYCQIKHPVKISQLRTCIQFNAVNIFKFILQSMCVNELNELSESDFIIKPVFKYYRLEILNIYLATLETHKIIQNIKSFEYFGEIKDRIETEPLFDLITAHNDDLSHSILYKIEIIEGLTPKILMNDIQYIGYHDDRLGLYKWIHSHVVSLTRSTQDRTIPIDRIIKVYMYHVTYRDDDMQKKILSSFGGKLKPLTKFINALDESDTNKNIKKLIEGLQDFHGDNRNLIMGILADYDRKSLFKHYLEEYKSTKWTELITKFIVEDDVDYLANLLPDNLIPNVRMIEHMVQYNSHKVYKKYMWGVDKIHFLSMYHLLKYKPRSTLYKCFMQNWIEIIGNRCDKIREYNDFLVAIVLSGNLEAIRTFTDKFNNHKDQIGYMIYKYSSPDVLLECLKFPYDKSLLRPFRVLYVVADIFKDHFMENYTNAEVFARYLYGSDVSDLLLTDESCHYKKALELIHKYTGFTKSELTRCLKVPGLNLDNREYLKSILEDGAYFENL